MASFMRVASTAGVVLAVAAPGVLWLLLLFVLTLVYAAVLLALIEESAR